MKHPETKPAPLGDYFVVVSDIHYRLRGNFKGCDTQAAWRQALELLRGKFARARCCLLLGDLSDNGSEASYLELLQAADPLPMPLLLTVGNHDDRDQLRALRPEAFTAAGYAQSSTAIAPGWRLLVLDSKMLGQAKGELCAERLGWLNEQLTHCAEPNLVIALHHPITGLGVPGLDSIALANGDELYQLLAPQRDRVKLLLNGHFHLSISANWRGLHLASLAALGHDYFARQPFGISLNLVMLGGGGDAFVHRYIQSLPADEDFPSINP